MNRVLKDDRCGKHREQETRNARRLGTQGLNQHDWTQSCSESELTADRSGSVLRSGGRGVAVRWSVPVSVMCAAIDPQNPFEQAQLFDVFSGQLPLSSRHFLCKSFCRRSIDSGHFKGGDLGQRVTRAKVNRPLAARLFEQGSAAR